MKIWTYCLAVAFIFVLISASSGGAAMMTPPAEGEQGSASAAQEPPPSATSPQGQDSPPPAGEQNASSPAPSQEQAVPSATSPQDAPPSAGEQNVSTPPTNQQEAPASATSPEGQGSPQAEGEQTVSTPPANQQGADSSATSSQGSLPAAAEQSAPATGQQATGQAGASPAASEQNATSLPAGGEQGTTSSATDQQASSPQGSSSSPTASEQSTPPAAVGQQATSPQGAPPAAAQGETPSATGPQSAYPTTETQQGSFPAGEQGAATLTLKESIGIALQKSPTLQSAQGAIKEAEYRRRAAFSDFLPQVNMQYTYTRLDRAPIITVPPAPPAAVGTTDNYNWSTSVSQPVFTGGALINSYLLAKIGVDSAKVTLEQAKRDLVLQVKVAYYAVLTAEKGVEVAQQAVQQVESHYTVAKAFFEVGITAKNDVLQVEVELAQTRQNLITAEHNLEVARAVFNTLMRRNINEPVRLAETLEYTPLTIDMNALYGEALRERPEIRLSNLGIQSAKKEVGIAASKLFPQLSIVYTYERQGDDPSVEGSRFERMHDWNVMGVAQWTIWDWGKAWWGVGESKARVFQAERALQQVKDAVILDVQAAALKVDEAKKNIQVAETAVSQAEEDSRINEERFKGQVATTTDVLDSLTRLTQARTNYYSALSDYNVAKARLQRAIGGM
jgi:outer membrane protein